MVFIEDFFPWFKDFQKSRAMKTIAGSIVFLQSPHFVFFFLCVPDRFCYLFRLFAFLFIVVYTRASKRNTSEERQRYRVKSKTKFVYKTLITRIYKNVQFKWPGKEKLIREGGWDIQYNIAVYVEELTSLIIDNFVF